MTKAFIDLKFNEYLLWWISSRKINANKSRKLSNIIWVFNYQVFSKTFGYWKSLSPCRDETVSWRPTENKSYFLNVWVFTHYPSLMKCAHNIVIMWCKDSLSRDNQSRYPLRQWLNFLTGISSPESSNWKWQ